MTVAVQPVAPETAPQFGILKVDQAGCIEEFAEKPKGKALERMSSGNDPDRPFLASMGIYVFKYEVLRELLEKHKKDDFGKHIIPGAIKEPQSLCVRVSATIGLTLVPYALFMKRTSLWHLPDPPFDLYDPELSHFHTPALSARHAHR